jgi:hypothetical protein
MLHVALQCHACCGTQAWSGMQDLELLLVDHNSLSGYLPEVWSSLRQLRILAVGAVTIAVDYPA